MPRSSCPAPTATSMPARSRRARAAIAAASVLLLQNEIGDGANVAAAGLAREAGAPSMLNAAPDSATRGARRPRRHARRQCRRGGDAGSGPVEDLDSCGRRGRGSCWTSLRRSSSRLVPQAWSRLPERDTWTVPAHPVERAQTHGAGDVFAGALAARLAHGCSAGEALRYANAAAALHVGTAAIGARRDRACRRRGAALSRRRASRARRCDYPSHITQDVAGAAVQEGAWLQRSSDSGPMADRRRQHHDRSDRLCRAPA